MDIYGHLIKIILQKRKREKIAKLYISMILMAILLKNGKVLFRLKKNSVTLKIIYRIVV